jgi:hypothetical protein
VVTNTARVPAACERARRYSASAKPTLAVISSFQDRHVVDLGGHVEDGVVDVTAVAA